MEVSNFYRNASDHNVMVFDTQEEVRNRQKRFLFDRGWVKLDGITEAVEQGWHEEVNGTEMFKVHQRVKNTRMALLAWHKPLNRNNENIIQVLTVKMEVMRAEMRDRDWTEWGAVKHELDCAHREEELFWRLKSKALWQKNGDSNTRFFHAYTAQRRRRNLIQSLDTGTGHICENVEDLKNHIVDFYSALFKTEGSVGGEDLLQHIPVHV
ncbi:reverse transcriptase [Striga asiatica]|uniref:Reverse transcriptase n=1 Tax=Striga asiatica TaxID=4170 RepID=A0A5A7R0C6_STRAF|nr:reverse transcriptase [Striga asiatica]